ncbi:hypothetical protein MNBD_ALPHA08-1045, partial [hydrothermal vent metagenome]
TRIGHAITTATLDLDDLKKSWTPITPSPWFRVVIIDQAGKRAWSNPVWLDEV